MNYSTFRIAICRKSAIHSTLLLFFIVGMMTGCGWMRTSCYYSDMPGADSFVQTSAGSIFVKKFGSGRPIVFVHGNLGTHADFSMSPLRPMLAPTFAVYALDRYGAGYSRRSPMRALTLEEHADIIAEVIGELQLEKPLLLGHSYGGAVSLMLALRHPDMAAGLVLIAPAAHDWQGEGVSEYRLLTAPIIGPILMQTAFVPLARLSLRSAMQSVFKPAAVPEEYLAYVRRVATVPEHFTASALDMQQVRSGLRTIARNYEELYLPVAVLVGDQDSITPFWNHGKRLQDRVATAQVRRIAGAGHQIHFSHPAEVLKAIRSFESK